MQFSYDDAIRRDFPELVSGRVAIDGLSASGDVSAAVAHFSAIAAARLAAATEGSFPEIAAWRRAFARMGLKPTQVRSASEALLRRFRTEGALPTLHPLVDLANAISIAFAIPVAVFDLDRISGDLEVRRATGAEAYETFAGAVERPEPGEVIFADALARAHARRWVHRQSGDSAVRAETTRALVVSEALHDSARDDVARLIAALAQAAKAAWPAAGIATEIDA